MSKLVQFKMARTSLLVVALLGLLAGSSCKRQEDSLKTQVRAANSLEQFRKHLAPGSLAGWNLVFVVLDTVRVDHLGCYGMDTAETPTVDALAAGGAQFMQAVTAVPSTLPSHCTMFTGLELPNHGVRTNANFTLKPETTTMAEVLSAKGYATAGFVSTVVLNARYGIGQGFDTYDDRVDDGDRSTNRPPLPRRAQEITDVAIAWLTDHLKAESPRPFFTWLHYFDAHLPYDPPEPFASRFAKSPYDGEIAYTDFHLGRFVDFLDQRNLRDSTLIVLLSDHGEGLGEHGEERHTRLIYDSTMRIPLIFQAPQFRDSPLRIDDVTVGTIDLMPTILSLLGAETNTAMDGIDLTRTPVSPDRAIYLETLAPRLYHGWASLHGLRRIDSKYIQSPLPEYFDLRKDPQELSNLLENKPDMDVPLAADLAERLSLWPTIDQTASKSTPLSPVIKQQLAALGYVTSEFGDGGTSPSRPDPKDMVPLFRDLKFGSAAHQNSKARTMAIPAGGDRAAYRQALILARSALAQTRSTNGPGESMLLTTLGITLYRTGDFAKAAQAFLEAENARPPNNENERVLSLAFRALTFHRLGRIDQARNQLQRLRDVLGTGVNSSGRSSLPFVKEAESVVGPA